MGLSTTNITCNVTLEDMRIGRSEELLVGNMTFHTLGLLVAAASAGLAILVSFFLILMHATHYTNPHEQRHIIRILFMVPMYATSALLAFRFYWHAVYFQVICDCYEAFAIASFFALLCQYMAPSLHEQKMYFRSIEPQPWVFPLNWARKCCGGERGPWRTPRSGLTWFNIIWAGVYHYCFIRVAMTVTAVVTQHFGRYCESSNSPVFAHVWIMVMECVAVTIAMYCLVQFYVQLRHALAPHRPFLKVLAIKLVIFLSFWQSFMLNILTSASFSVIRPTPTMAYPDLKVGIPSLLLCIEMALFALLHLVAFSWKPYASCSPGCSDPMSAVQHPHGPNQGGFLGLRAFADAMNPWDLVKAFARAMRWLFVGVKRRENDPSYKPSSARDDGSLPSADATTGHKRNTSKFLPIAHEFRRSRFGLPVFGTWKKGDEDARLIAHAQPHSSGLHSPNPFQTFQPKSGYVPARLRYDAYGKDISSGGTAYEGDGTPESPHRPSAICPNSRRGVGTGIPEPSPTLPSPSDLREERRRLHPGTPTEQWARARETHDPVQLPTPSPHCGNHYGEHMF